MSLLIKALNKAEEAQAQSAISEQAQAEKAKIEANNRPEVISKPHSNTSQNLVKTASTDLELSLSPTGNSFSETVVKPASVAAEPVSTASTAASSQQSSKQYMAAKSAANVFSAKGIEAKTDSARLAMIAGAGLIALLGMGLYFYQFVDSTSPIVLPARPLEPIVIAPKEIPLTEVANNNINEFAAEPLDTAAVKTVASAAEAVPPADELLDDKPLASNKKNKKTMAIEEDETTDVLDESAESATLKNEALADQNILSVNDESSNRMQASFSANKANKKPRKSKNNASIASESASISVTKSTPQPEINPVLMSAYEAYNAGNDKDAIKLYKQVLQRDVRNLDALLGLGAIAARQGRNADANGWYGKVLELDPRNNIAKTAMLESNLQSNQSQGNELTNETSLKNMLARQPDDANLHVALGNLYAEQNQWPAAQQAYFDAYSINKTADNAYNLAVSLDQMGKPKLALPYYVRALEQATDASNIDKVALQARINAIQ